MPISRDGLPATDFQRLLEGLTQFVAILNPDGSVLWVNQAALQLAELTMADVRDRYFADCYWWSYSPESRALVDEAILTARRGDFFKRDAEVRTIGSGRLWVEFRLLRYSSAAGGDYLVASGLDITDRKTAELQIRESRERLDLALEAAHFGTWQWDTESGFSWWDDRLARLVRMDNAGTADDAARFLSRIHPEDLPRVERDVQRALKHRSKYRHEFRFRRQDGTEIWLAAHGFSRDGRELFGVNYDISDLKRSQAQKQAITDGLEERVDEQTRALLRQANRLRRLSRELTHAESRERRRVASALHDGLQQMLVAADLRVQRLLIRSDAYSMDHHAEMEEVQQHIRDAAQASRTLAIELSPPVLHEQGLVPALQWLADHFGAQHELEVSVSAHTLTHVPDFEISAFLYGAVRELLFNVVKHAGGERAEVHVESNDSDSISVTVRDFGPGVGDVNLDCASSIDSGMGLFGIRERLRAMSGRLTMRDAPGGGCEVVLQAPTGESNETFEVENPDTIKSASEDSDVEALRVLVVDDHSLVREGVKLLLGDMSRFDVVGEAESGRQAIERCDELYPDVVLMDVTMPDMDGIEATRRITQLESNRQTRVVGLSMHDDPSVRDAMIDAGASAFVTKGGEPAELFAAVCGE